MGDVGDDYKVMNETSKVKRADNRNSSPAYLEKHCIPFTVKNNGAHLIVEGSKGFIDFWPGTGKWIARSGKKGFGVKGLIMDIEMMII